MHTDLATLIQNIEDCQLCAKRFAQTASQHAPRPVIWVNKSWPPPRLLIAGQAPGARVHQSGRPFTDASGDRLRDWLGLSRDAFYDRSKIAIVPMAFCFPGYNAQGSDLPPPPICARSWRTGLMEALPNVPLTLLIGGHAMKWHLGRTCKVTETVAAWKTHAPAVFPLPHPSWRNTAWLKKNPWFAAELLPVLKARVKEVLQ